MKKSSVAISLALVASTLVGHAGAVHDAGLFSVSLGRNDDSSSTAVELGFNVSIGGRTYSRVYVNNNGNVTFNGPLASFIPSAISAGNYGPIIAPFFSDIDTRNPAASPVTYGQGVIGGRSVFGVNYLNVGEYPNGAILNRIQLILTDRSDVSIGDFDIQFNYDQIGWGQRNVLVGYWTGNDSTYTLDGSLSPGAFLDGGPNALRAGSLNSSVNGQYNFAVRGGVASVVPEPKSFILLGLGAVIVFGSVLCRQH